MPVLVLWHIVSKWQTDKHVSTAHTTLVHVLPSGIINDDDDDSTVIFKKQQPLQVPVSAAQSSVQLQWSLHGSVIQSALPSPQTTPAGSL